MSVSRVPAAFIHHPAADIETGAHINNSGLVEVKCSAEKPNFLTLTRNGSVVCVCFICVKHVLNLHYPRDVDVQVDLLVSDEVTSGTLK